MSLTSFLEVPENRALLSKEFPKPEARLKDSALALLEPRSKRYGLVGTAYDYLVRFEFQRRYPSANRKSWVAETALGRLALAERSGVLGQGLKAESELAFKRAAAEQKAFLKTGAVTDSLLSSVMDLAKLDTFYRSGYPPADFGDATADELLDLGSLFRQAPASLYERRSEVWLNPTFGAWSSAIGGADADLVLDGTLYDIKTVKDLKLSVDTWLQLVGYSMLSDLAVRDGAPAPKIHSVGVYFSRFGVLWQTDIRALKSSAKWTHALEWLETALTEESIEE